MPTYDHAGFTFDYSDSGPDDSHTDDSHTDDRASDETVILLHGFPQSGRSWDRVTPLLVDAGYRVLAPDQRGYSPGARPRRRRDYTIELLTGDVLALADAVGVDRFHVVGHDWGGAVAWSLGANHPDRIVTMTSLATPHPKAMLSAMTSSNQALMSWYMVAFQVPGIPEWMVTNGLASGRFVETLVESGLPATEAAANVEMLRNGAARGAFNWYRALPFSKPSAVGDVDVPTLYVYGDDDLALGVRAAELTADHVKGEYRYERLRGADHWLPETSSVEVSTLVIELLEKHPI